MSTRKRLIAVLLALVLVGQIVEPTLAYALSSGPSQPEVQGFQPAGVNDLVDPFSGDFSYNIPLLDVEGYPVNLFYRAGITPDQEASWVGLGWNLTPGVVERSLRGLPDDFAGEEIVREVNLRPNRTFGLSFGVGLQLFGMEQNAPVGLGSNISISPSFNNYDGPQFETAFSLSMRSTLDNGCSMNVGLGLTSHSNRGLQLRPTIGFDKRINSKYFDGGVKPGLNFGLTIDSRQGLTNASFGATVATSRSVEKCHPTNAGKDINTRVGATNGVSTAFDMGSPSYTPQVTLPMDNRSLSFNFTVGPAVTGAHPNMTLGAFFSRQKLVANTIRKNAYGYLHLHEAGHEAMLDFNREKDGPFSTDKTALGIPSPTNDVFTVSGQGVSGSYRAFRSEVGHLHDPSNGSGGSGGSAGLEFGAGFIAHVGGNVLVNNSTSTSGDWGGGNQAGQVLRYRSLSEDPLLEPVFFREANEATVEQDPQLWNSMQQDRPARFTLPSSGQYDVRLGTALTADNGGTTSSLPSVNYRREREPRAQVFSYLTHKEAGDFAVQQPVSHAGVAVKGHHMSEVSITQKDGGRYIYGIPAYNVTQKDVEFNVSVGNEESGWTAPPTVTNGLVSYTGAHASTANGFGKDHYYSSSTTPAYPYAFLLTSVLSTDYSDIDNVRGPSDGDIGNYTKFGYERTSSAFPWRTPASGGTADMARYERGLGAEYHDEKATYVYGTKEIWYLRTIESRNFIAVFTLNDASTDARLDAQGVQEDGSTDHSAKSRFLRTIKLYEKQAYLADPVAAVPIKTVHFDYAYTLCHGTKNTQSNSGGKLTLKRVWFTYGASQRGLTAPYAFSYHGETTDPAPWVFPYGMNDQDRWGNYKPDNGALPNEEFPYAAQQASAADANAQAWNLKRIDLPSGGSIAVDYEADDYAWVQNKRAMRMFRISGIGTSSSVSTSNSLVTADNYYLHFDVGGDEAAMPGLNERLFEGIDDDHPLYFRSSVVLFDGRTDYVSGYCRIDRSPSGHGVDGSGHGWVRLLPVTVDEDGGPNVNPIYRSALEHLQLNYPDRVHPGAPSFSDGESGTEAFFYGMITSVAGFVAGIGDFFQGPNEALQSRGGLCETVELGKTWIRLCEPDHRKKGGGYRVKKVEIRDNWGSMEASETGKAFTYGQTYAYGDADGSFGVAAYEPMSGADENPWRMPVYGTRHTNALASDERFYQEEPFGESMFPGPVVGYSKVIVSDLYPEEGVRTTQGTGTVVHEFYTARDFPTITARTELRLERRVNQANLLSILGFKKIDHAHTSQGFVVETNDMHGKPKRVSVLPEGSDQPVSTVTYTYATNGATGGLVNTATVVGTDGTVGQAEIGRQYEFVADMREFSSYSSSGGAELNMESIWAVLFPALVPVILPRFSSQSTRFKSGVLLKRIHRFGRLAAVTKTENGSTISTENLAYDALTGNVLLTRTQNDFEDPLYSMTFPAYWYHDGMGPAYRNLGASLSIEVNDGVASVPDARTIFVPGDEVEMFPTIGGPIRGWVDQVGANSITLIDKVSAPPSDDTYAVKIIRSGRRNMQDASMMTLVAKSDPLQGLHSGNVYANILKAQATEFSGTWRTECACVDPVKQQNDWRLDRKGAWRPWKEDVWLTDRTRSIFDNNANIRADGVYAAFSPLYKALNGHWSKYVAGWTTAREVTQYNARGQEVENKDALGIRSSATFGYRGNLVKSVARNAMYREAGFDGFEEKVPYDCADQHFRFAPSGSDVTQQYAHTGRYSLKVQSSTPISFTTTDWNCDQSPCHLHAGYYEGQIYVGGGTAPYTLTPFLLDGDALFAPNANGLAVTATGAWRMRLEIQDANGCTYTQLLEHAP